MAMRATWTGSITFSLLNIPVKVYTAIESGKKIAFNQLHKGECMGQVGQTKACKTCDAELNTEDIIKGYQHEPGKWITVQPDELATIKLKTDHAIEITGFVQASEIPSSYLDAPYYAGPNGPSAGKSYALLRLAMIQTGRVGIGKVILRDREEMVVLSPQDDGLMIQTLRYAHEVRSMENVPAIDAQVEPKENEMRLAQSLIEDMSTSFDQIEAVDDYYTALSELLDNKIKGNEITTVAETATAAPDIDIMAALEASLRLNSAPQPAPAPATTVEMINTEPTPAAAPMLRLLPTPGAEEKPKRKRRAA